MKRLFFIYFVMAVFSLCATLPLSAKSVREERILINEGNKLYNKGEYAASAAKYREALSVNPESAVGMFNLAMSNIIQVKNPKDTTQRNQKFLSDGREMMGRVAEMGGSKPQLASKANYALGNLAFNSEDYQGAVNFYKQALRLDPDYNSARKNLRIAQLKLQQQQDQNKDQNKDQQNKDQNKDQDKDQNKDQQDQNKDQNKDQQDQNKQQNPPRQNQIDQQTADQILKAGNNKEAATRSKYNASKAEKKGEAGKSNKNW